MIRMRLHTAKTVVVGLLGMVAAGCVSDKSAQTTLHFWAIGTEVEKIGDLFKDFERQNPGVRVEVQQLAWSAAHEKLLTAFVGDALPDVFQIGNTWIPEFATLRALEPLDQWVQKSSAVVPSDYFAGLWETNRMSDHLYGVPWYADTRVLFYRKSMLANAGWPQPPRTWSEWLAAMRDIKRKVNPHGYAILMPTNEWEHLTILGLQTGTAMLRDDGRYANFNSPEFRRALEFYATIFDEELAPPVRNTEISNYWEEFARGYFAMYITGPWNIGEFRRLMPADKKDDWATTPIPRPDGAEFSISQAGGSGLAIAHTSRHQEVAWRFVEYLSQPEQLVRLYKLTGNLPPREAAWKLGQIESDPPVRAFHEQLQHAAPLPRVPEWDKMTTKIMEAGQAIVARRATIDAALAELDRAVNEILEKRRSILARHAEP